MAAKTALITGITGQDGVYLAALLLAKRQGAGQANDMRDTQIAGIALSRRAAVATRNTRHFAGSGLKLINPWD